jgi:hypothetical protein
MLISVHMPKTAGSSFLASMRQQFGDALLTDYGDRPINRSGMTRNSHALAASLWHGISAGKFAGVECVHGHFMPLKYNLLGWRAPLQFVTWLREPVERLGSHYHYWMRHYDPHDSGELHRRVVEEQWSLERFCLGPELQDTYCKFLWGFPLDRFGFVGITEHYDQDLARFASDILGNPIELRRDNVNPERERNSYFPDQGLRREIEAHHARDMMLYRQALANRSERLDQSQASAPLAGRVSPGPAK